MRAASGTRSAGWRSLFWPAVLTVLAFVQQPGRLTSDSRLDLAVDPGALLRRTLTFWDGSNGLGGVGNQGVGYLFPTGPFYAVGDLLGVPLWAVQRAWTAVLLVVAFEGLRRLCLLVIGPEHRGAAVLAGLAWSLSPRMMTELGPLSTETLPMVLLPWTVLPLMAHLPAGRVLRGCLGSAVAVLLMGGTNAAASLAVLPAAGLWIATRPWPWRRRARVLGLWSAGVVAVSLWWLVPLLLLGGVGPPFLDWIETSASTASQIGALAALRGTDHWIAYAPGTVWPGATQVAGAPLLVVTTTVLAALGLAGLVQRRMPERRWLVLLAALGLVALTLAHRGPGLVTSPFSGLTAGLLDGPLAPLRNLHKADPLLRLPLVLGVAHLVARGSAFATARPGPGPRRAVARAGRGFPVLVGLLLLAGSAPLLTGQLRPGPAFRELPQAWREAAAVLAAADRAGPGNDPGRTLLLPAAGFGRYTWGRSLDEPLQALTSGRWAVRDQVPLAAPGSTRLLDAVDAVLASGQGSPALADLLARSGFARVLVRNDLDLQSTGAVQPALVRQALERSPGLRRIRSFGPTDASDVAPLSAGLQVSELELWEVAADAHRPAAVPLTDLVRLSGGPEDLLTAIEGGLLRGDEPTVLAGQPDGALVADLPQVVTDGFQRRERAFGSVRHPWGPVLTADDPLTLDQPVPDLLPFPGDGRQTTAKVLGARAVRASSSLAAPGTGLLARQAYAAVDGDPGTWWQSDPMQGPAGQWLQVDLGSPVAALSVSLNLRVAPIQVGPPVTRVRLTTDTGSRVVMVQPTEQPQVLALPTSSDDGEHAGRPVTFVRVTVESAQGALGGVGISELTIPGVTVSRTLVAPPEITGAPRGWSFSTVDPPIGPCVLLDGVTRCDAGLTRSSSEETVLDRSFVVPSAADAEVRGTVVARPGPAAERLLTPLDAGVLATSDSRLPGTLLTSAAAAVDGDPASTWVADPLDPDPELQVQLRDVATLTGIQLSWPAQPLGSRPQSVLLSSPAGMRLVSLSPRADGASTVRFAPLTTDAVTLSFPSRTTVTRAGRGLPLAVGEVTLVGAPPVVGLADGVRTGAPCGFGPPVVLDGRTFATSVEGTVGAVRQGRPLSLSLCGPDGSAMRLGLAAGPRRLEVRATGEFSPRSLQIVVDGPSSRAPDRAVTVIERGESRRTIDVGRGGPALLIVPESVSVGWTARLDGAALPALATDGWQQGYLLPAGEGGRVELVFGPDRLYRLSLVLGGGLALLVLLTVLVHAVSRVRSRSQVAQVGQVAQPGQPPGGSLPAERVGPGRRVVTAVLAAVAAALLLGPVCGAGLLAAALVVRRPAVGGGVAGVLLLASAGPVLARGTASLPAVQAGAVAQTLALLAVGCAAGCVLRLRVGPRPVAEPSPPSAPLGVS